jgi:hypothetical protein
MAGHTRALTRYTAVLLSSGILLATVISGVGEAGSSTASTRAEAKQHLLTLKDMPTGWTTEKGSTVTYGSGGAFPDANRLAGCIGVPVGLIEANPPTANSPNFQSKDGSLQIQDSVSVFPSVKTATAEMASFNKSKTPACLASFMNSSSTKSEFLAKAPKGSALGTVTVTDDNHPKGISELTAVFPITSQGVSARLKFTLVSFVKGKLGRQISFNAYGPTFPRSVIEHVTSEAQRSL